MSHDTIASRWNLDVVEAAYQAWRQDPSSVDANWQQFFEGFELGLGRAGTTTTDATFQTGIVRLVFAYRNIGHFLAHLDMLTTPRAHHPLLDLSEFGLTEADLDRSFSHCPFLGLKKGTLRELIAALRETYCRTIGVEYMHIQDSGIRHWLQERMEPCRNHPSFDRAQKIRILQNLHYAELFEKFLHVKYRSQKRFSLEGAETLIPLLEALVEKSADIGVQEIVLGMAHRGRLNVLANTLRKPYEDIFAQFEENYIPELMDGDGDVKYHLGFSCDRVNSHGKKLHLSLTPNPSHLEAVNPVVEGRTRAKQRIFGDLERKRGIPLLIHGDAAMAGQGLVTETLNLSQLEGYTTGGTLHVVINNQIGFTTAPNDARSTKYCTDVVKMLQVPIFHVNGEDAEATVFLAELALDFRQEFNKDVVIDMFCYRRHGHNEGDEPSFTQPIMYSKIKERPSFTSIYTDHLLRSGDLTPEETDAIRQKFEDKLQRALEEVRTGPHQYPGMRGFGGYWKDLTPTYTHKPVETAISEEMLKYITGCLVRVPPHFTMHPTIARIFHARVDDVHAGKPIDWPLAELLSFGSLLMDGNPVRLSGQDSRRGTFSQRHAVLYDARSGEPFFPLNELKPNQGQFTAYNSLLSEAAVLGFEYGYALDSPYTLVLWEAQFGDFVNGAQVIIDQFVAASTSKWQRDCGVVLLLPHGYEGQGPEHSSGRLERFLQLCAEDNLQVCYPSTPAQYFHLLRRQLKRNFRKPLIVMTPKSLLRHKAAVSPQQEFTQGRFQEILDDATADPAAVRKVLLCSGKVYYELVERRAEQKANDVAIVRVEQFYPLHEALLKQVLGRYRKTKSWIWVQEESQNMGGWSFMEPRLRALGYQVDYVGRDASASPATGSLQIHKLEQKELVEAAISGQAPHLVRASQTNGNGQTDGQPATAEKQAVKPAGK